MAFAPPCAALRPAYRPHARWHDVGVVMMMMTMGVQTLFYRICFRATLVSPRKYPPPPTPPVVVEDALPPERSHKESRHSSLAASHPCRSHCP